MQNKRLIDKFPKLKKYPMAFVAELVGCDVGTLKYAKKSNLISYEGALKGVQDDLEGFDPIKYVKKVYKKEGSFERTAALLGLSPKTVDKIVKKEKISGATRTVYEHWVKNGSRK